MLVTNSSVVVCLAAMLYLSPEPVGYKSLYSERPLAQSLMKIWKDKEHQVQASPKAPDDVLNLINT